MRGNPIDHEARQTGAVLIFRRGITVEDARELLERFAEELKLDGEPVVRAFNPTYGSPVFYVP